jgi:hypothetical protein
MDHNLFLPQAILTVLSTTINPASAALKASTALPSAAFPDLHALLPPNLEHFFFFFFFLIYFCNTRPTLHYPVR